MKKVFLFVGIALVLTSIFAQQIGIDNDEGWGRGRIIMLASGFSLILASLLIESFQRKSAELKKHVSGYLIVLNHPTQIALISSFTAIIVLTAYVWFSQPATRDSQNNYNYYSELAIGFKAGHLYLTEEPSSALLSFSNPYDYLLRKEYGLEDFPWDVSLYNNKFYLYWGPAPSLILIAFSNEQLSNIGDHHLSLIFAYGLFLYSSLIVMSFWHRSLKHISIWLFGIILFAIGLITPVTIMLKESRISEAAVFGCQFFFIGGCYWAYSSINNNKLSLWRLTFAGLHWALALGTRITILPVIIFAATVTVLYILKTTEAANLKSYFPPLVILGLPLALAMVSLSWYNWARFGSIFEFGIKYQLTNVDYNVFKDSFAIQYIRENLYNYFLHPFKLITKFPYIMRIEFPASNDRLAGLIYLSPYIFLIFAPLLHIFSSHHAVDKSLVIQETEDPSEKWLITTFTGSAFIGMVTILSFYFVTMRYIEDFMPSLILLITIQLGRELRRYHENNVSGKILAITTTVLAIFTITANVLIAIPNSGTVFMINLLNDISKILGLK